MFLSSSALFYFIILNTQYMTNSTLVFPVKMEYVTKINIFGLKMMMKSGLEKIILKFFHALTDYHVISITEFVLLTKTSHFYEVSHNGEHMEEFQKYFS